MMVRILCKEVSFQLAYELEKESFLGEVREIEYARACELENNVTNVLKGSLSCNRDSKAQRDIRWIGKGRQGLC